MTVQAACDEIRERALAERYVTGKLPEPEASEFEAHYLTCERCQADLRLASAIRSAPVEPARGAIGRWWGLGLAAAAGLTAVLLLIPRPGDEGLTPLGGVIEPPLYLGVAVRATPAAADSLFQSAMEAYASRRYAEAAVALDGALRAGIDSAPAEFFRASSWLMSHRDSDAAAGFQRVIAMGDTPYRPESHYYLAKALLRLGRAREAVVELRRIDPGNEELRRQADALADSVEAVAR